MTANNSIFLYITEGRTLWVPGHTPAAGENKPVHILNFATPRELSRSFYLFDMPIQLVQDAQTAAMIPGGKTPEDVIIAVNEFRRVCTEDQDFLLQRCYDANKPPPPQQQQQQPQQQAQQQQQLLLPGGGAGGIGDSFNLQQNPSLNVAQSNPNQAFLLQLLQQQQQQQQRMAMMPQASPLQQPPPMTFNRGSMMGVGGNMMMNNGGMMMPPNLPMMPNNNNNNYGNHMMSFGRGVGLMPAPNSSHSIFPGMGTGPIPTMMGGGRGMGRGGRMLNNAFQAPVREQPEPLPPLAPIPDDILQIYMNPQQKLMCATMPGPRCTVWLREHEIPSDTRNPRYVFCKGGIVLMLKTKGSEIEKSKPVELFEQQVCAHFLIHNYCSRTNCLHRHHTEAQLRQLIASKHVQLKSMTKKERHRLSELVLEKDREGLARIAEDREKRAKEKMEQAKRREAMSGGSGTTTNNTNDNNNNNSSNNTTNNSNNRDDNTVASGSTDVSRTLLARGNVGGSDDDDEEESINSNNNKTTDNATTSNRVNDKKDVTHKSTDQRTIKQENGSNNRNPAESTVSSRRAAPFSSRRVQSTVDIGVTDSEDEDDDDDDSSSSASSSSSSSSSSSNVSKKTNEAAEAKEKSEEAANSKECAGSERETEETKATAASLMLSEACEKKEGEVQQISEMDVKMTLKDEKAHDDHTIERETELAQQQQQQVEEEEEKKKEEEEEKKSVVVEEEEEERGKEKEKIEDNNEKEEEQEQRKEEKEAKESSDAVHKPAESDNEEEEQEETNVVDEKKKKAKPRGKNGAAKHGRSTSPKKTAPKTKRTKK